MNRLWVYRLLIPLVRLLPQQFVYWIGLRVADRCYARDEVGRTAVLSNLKQIFAWRGLAPTEDALNGFARKTYQYFGKNCVDFFRFSRFTRDELDRLVSFEQLQHLESAHAEGKGVILLTAHFGNWELAAAALVVLGYPVNAVVLPEPRKKIDSLYQDQRRRRGMNVIRLGRSPRTLMHCLERGEPVALLGDRDFSPGGVDVPLFGRAARLPRGPAWLSVKTGAPIVPCFLWRQVDDTFFFRFHEPIWPQGKSLEEVQGRACRVLEREIAEHPNQWFIFEDFWKSHDDDR